MGGPAKMTGGENMKHFILLAGVFILFVSDAAAQNQQTRAVREIPASEKNQRDRERKIVKAAGAGMTMSLPAGFGKVDLRVDSNKNNEVEWTTRAYSSAKPGKARLEVELIFTQWNKDFQTIVPDLVEATPERLLLADYIATQKQTETDAYLVELTDYLELDNVVGLAARWRMKNAPDEVRVAWNTYRYHKGKAQSIVISMKGARSDLSEMVEILDSVRFD